MTDEEFWQALRAMPGPKPVDYRIYYNEQGELLFYSMDDLPGTYISIDADAFARCATNVVVQDGKLFEIVSTTTVKLQPSDTGTPCHPDDVSIVVPETHEHQRWSKQTHGLKPN
jgi:hypothetical protein